MKTDSATARLISRHTFLLRFSELLLSFHMSQHGQIRFENSRLDRSQVTFVQAGAAT